MIPNGEGAASDAPDPPASPIVRKEGPLATGEKFDPSRCNLTVVLLVLWRGGGSALLPAITWGVALAGHRHGRCTPGSFCVDRTRTLPPRAPLPFVAPPVVVPACSWPPARDRSAGAGPRPQAARLDPGSPGRHSANGSGCRLGRPGRRGYR